MSPKKTAAAIGCMVLVPTLVWATLAIGSNPQRVETRDPLRRRDLDYIGASTCRSCHPDHHASWRRTYHSTMTQLPNRTSVLGRFDGVPVNLFGASATPIAQDGRYYFDLPALGGDPPRRAEVTLMVGSRRLQEYFERREDSNGTTYRRLPLLWHVAEARWLHVNGAFLYEDRDDWSGGAALWNPNCIFCHNTGVAPGLKPASNGIDKAFDSHVADLGIACEACHGPGRQHAERHRSLFARYGVQLGMRKIDDIVDPLRLGQAESAALCGQCHSQRVPAEVEQIWTYLDTGPTFRPGGVLDGHVNPITRDTPVPDANRPDAFRNRFWADGTARLTAYEYLGMTQSPCFRGGTLTCNSCHTMHGGDVRGQIEPSMRGDRACTQCHAEIARDIPKHTHHPAASSGSRCLECHMPRIVYGILDLHRSHRVESPDVKRDVEGGRPNACGICHLDKSALWAADRMRELWGPRHERPVARKDGAPLDLADGSASMHAGDPVQRAVFVYSLGRPDSAVTGSDRALLLGNALVGLGDSYGAVRFLARRAALDLDGVLGLGLADELRAFDPQGAPADRQRALFATLHAFEEAARARLPPAPSGMLVEPNYQLTRGALNALFKLQQQHQIETGE